MSSPFLRPWGLKKDSLTSQSNGLWTTFCTSEPTYESCIHSGQGGMVKRMCECVELHSLLYRRRLLLVLQIPPLFHKIIPVSYRYTHNHNSHTLTIISFPRNTHTHTHTHTQTPVLSHSQQITPVSAYSKIYKSFFFIWDNFILVSHFI